jgi:tetratricopeptide (TPR) repeat protein
MKDILYQYLRNPKNSSICFKLGWEYEKIGQTASAVGFYLRSTEFGTDTKQNYEALIRIALCFIKQGDRIFIIKGFLLRAITLIPNRPEAYYLLAQTYQNNREWQEAYTTAVMGYTFGLDNTKPTTNLTYPDNWIFLFQKAVNGWQMGLFDESLHILRVLNDNPTIGDEYKNIIKNDLIHLGNNWKEPLIYTNEEYKSLRYKFNDAHLIKKNYSQSYQDLFVLMVLNGKRNGSWIEIGCAHPTYGNNTKLLEELSWSGISIDIDTNVVENWKDRKTIPYQIDATKVDWDKIDLNNITDYLQIDVDPPEISYEVLLSIPLWEKKFRVITFEHDYYTDNSKTIREKSRKYLRSFGYELVVNDIAVDEYSSYEDWWVHPDLVDPKIIEVLKSSKEINPANKYIFGIV